MIEFAAYGEKHGSLFTLASWGEFGKVKTIELALAAHKPKYYDVIVIEWRDTSDGGWGRLFALRQSKQ